MILSNWPRSWPSMIFTAAGDTPSSFAMLLTTCTCRLSSRLASTSAALSGSTWASTRAMVWGRSLRRVDTMDFTSTLSMKEKGLCFRDLVTLPSISSAAWGP